MLTETAISLFSTKNKLPGLNDVPPEAFKSLSEANKKPSTCFFVAYWNDEVDFAEWYEGQFVPIPKKGDLFDPNKW